MCVHVCVPLLKMIYEENFPHYLPAEDPESVIAFISPCKTDHFFLPDPLFCNTEPRQVPRSADSVSLRSALNATVQSVHLTPLETPQATHLAFPLKQNTECHPSNPED